MTTRDYYNSEIARLKDEIAKRQAVIEDYQRRLDTSTEETLNSDESSRMNNYLRSAGLLP